MDRDITYEEFQERIRHGILTSNGKCPVTTLLSMLQGKWTFLILYEMCIKDNIRFGELRKSIGDITNTMLTTSLRELESDGLVSRKQYNEIPPRVEYMLTQKGKELLPVFYQMTIWGLHNIS